LKGIESIDRRSSVKRESLRSGACRMGGYVIPTGSHDHAPASTAPDHERTVQPAHSQGPIICDPNMAAIDRSAMLFLDVGSFG